VAWAPLFAHHALSFDLSLDQGDGAVRPTAASLARFCEAVLASPPNPPAQDITREDIYRVSFNVKTQRSFVFDQNISIGVQDGVCQPREVSEAFVHAYPDPMTHWALRRDLDPGLAAGEAPEFSFTWTGAGAADLDAFPFEAACEAVILDPPAELARGADEPPETVTLWAEKEVGDAGSGQFTASTQVFEIVDGACVKVSGS